MEDGLRRAVFLDRDGVLNRVFLHGDGKTHPPAGPDELEILPGVGEACVRLRRAGYLLIVVSNQPDVARGTQSREVVEAINGALREQVPVDDIRVCYHDDPDDCGCRKPKPGLLLEAARDWQIDLTTSFMVGDRWTDIEAGRRAGCKTFFVDHKLGSTEKRLSHPSLRRAPLDELGTSLRHVQDAAQDVAPGAGIGPRRASERAFFSETKLAKMGQSNPDFRVASLLEAADWIVGQGVEL